MILCACHYLAIPLKGGWFSWANKNQGRGRCIWYHWRYIRGWKSVKLEKIVTGLSKGWYWFGARPLCTWWRHQKETFSALLAICAGIHRSPVNSPHKGQWRGALMFSLICVWINDWVNNREAGDLRRYRAHYDVIVMRLHWVFTTSS